MDVADSSDSDRSVNRLCSLSTKFRCVVWSSSFSMAICGEVSCGREQRFRRSEQVAATGWTGKKNGVFGSYLGS